ncbi:MAG: ROK family protein [Acidobacteriota bacterium]|nr:ROK family protein [Acidobacteriota bacterium]MDE3222140.1 ROK family protein [Acidobacteriota bacterium]
MSDVAIGVDVGGTKSLALLVARDGRVLGERVEATPHEPANAPGHATAATVEKLVRALCEPLGLRPDALPVGLGLAGMVRRDGRLAFAPNLPGASGAEVGTLLGVALGSSLVVVENDANCAARAEHAWGAARGVANFVMVTLGTGIGGGVVSNGSLMRGQSGFAGEIGHMVVAAHGAPCPCGGRGCWERYASGGGLRRLALEAISEGRLADLAESVGDVADLRAEDVVTRARAGDAEALSLMAEMGWWLARGVANLSAILDCGHFLVGGGLGAASELFLPSTRTALVHLVEGYHARAEITVTPSLFGPRSGALGAALVALERLT